MPSLPEMPAEISVVLLAEDEAVIALEIEDDLREAGYAVAGPFGSCEDAMAWLETRSPAAAIIDNDLTDGPCTALIGELRRRGIPFAIHSGHSRRTADLPDLDDVPWIEKPAAQRAVVDAIAEMLRHA